MKKTAVHRAAGLLAGILAGLLALSQLGCTNGVAQETQSGGSLVVKLPSSPGSTEALGVKKTKTILPDFASIVNGVNVTVSASGQSPQTQTASSTSGSVTFTGLAAASWTIAVSALENGTVIGTGSATVTVSSGSSATITVPISFSGFTSGTGTLSIPISWPSSTGVDYLSWSIDNGSSTAASVTTSGSSYTTTIGASLSSGAHALSLIFKKGGASGTQAGSFVESVDVWNGLTSGGWIDGSGTVQSAMSFTSSAFLDSNAALAGLAIQAGSTSLSIGFSSTTTNYDLGLQHITSLSFTPTSSLDGQSIQYSWNGASSVIASGASSGTLTLKDSGGGVNTLVVTVTAPDRATQNTYTTTITKAYVDGISATIVIPTPGSIAFSGTVTVAHGTTLNLSVSESFLSYQWYMDGSELSGMTSQSISIDTNSYSVGVHRLSVVVCDSSGVSSSATETVLITSQ